jgi:hypothetical protein
MSRVAEVPMNREATPLRHWRRAAASGARALAALVLLAGLGGCGFYSLTGATVPAHLETVAIPLAEDRTVGAPAGLDQRLTDLLVDRFTGRTRLVLVPDETAADAVLLATIERYTNEPAAVTGQEVAALNRVSITVHLRYVDRVQERDRLSRPFSGREDYDATRIDLEASTAQLALEQIADDIFTAATSDW